ncbi:hypothetical protein HXX76_014869 [Chlamydomonas incerta]|uniref:Ribonuclease n=1 Tax=Chlamydomonas incerta TaxID=51695 RepID=A0A835VSB8_CHLIN|nr:hypothetical protein HXX76_014869 [Chlamydomonas incerta]|eukprot:KAG2424048.1 hypothetical protein HXX76_014869 [Chlamydomonas incerta]
MPAGLNDSKAITEAEREAIYTALTADPRVRWAVSIIDHDTIDRINILQAALGAMRNSALDVHKQAPGLDYLLVDGNKLPKDLPCPARAVVKGDATVACIAAASIIAKVTRDRLMLELDKLHPEYGFAQHKGYGVPQHMAAIHTHGPSAVHRRSFEPVKSMTGWTREKALVVEAEDAKKATAGKATATRKRKQSSADVGAVATAPASSRRSGKRSNRT